jgi:hypothetical protein
MSPVKKYQLGEYVRMQYTKGDVPAGAVGFVQERNFDEKWIAVEFGKYPKTRFSEIEIDEYLFRADWPPSVLNVTVNDDFDDEKDGPFKDGQHLRLVKDYCEMPAGSEATVLSVWFNGDIDVEFSSGWVAKLNESEAVEYFGVTVNDDPVNHPKHYTSHPSGIECIQITEHMSFNVGNAIKYLWRADEKGAPIQDLEKAKWYIEREIQRRAKNVS